MQSPKAFLRIQNKKSKFFYIPNIQNDFKMIKMDSRVPSDGVGVNWLNTWISDSIFTIIDTLWFNKWVSFLNLMLVKYPGITITDSSKLITRKNSSELSKVLQHFGIDGFIFQKSFPYKSLVNQFWHGGQTPPLSIALKQLFHIFSEWLRSRDWKF